MGQRASSCCLPRADGRTGKSSQTSFQQKQQHGVQDNEQSDADEGQLLAQLPILPDSWEAQIQVEQFSKQDRVFLQCPILPEFTPIRTFVGRYRHTNEWFLCRIRSYDCDGSFSVVWEDGTMQMGTKAVEELKRMSNEWSRRVDQQIEMRQNRVTEPDIVMNNSSPSMEEESALRPVVEPPTHNGFTVWEAAKKGDMETVLALIDRGDATPNTVEILSGEGRGGEEQAGRSSLYWACFGGHVELVRELLARGGVDADGAAYLAVTSRERANDDRDLMFDPDTNTFSDWVDYPTTETADTTDEESRDEDENENDDGGEDTAIEVDERGEASVVDLVEGKEKRRQKRSTSRKQQDDAALIRAMLAASSVTPAKRRRNMDSMRQRLPQRLYNATAQSEIQDYSECIVCLNQTSSRSHSKLLVNDDDPLTRKEENRQVADQETVSLSIAVPCGHICACQSCLELIRKRGDGCPICRAAISAIVPHRT